MVCRSIMSSSSAENYTKAVIKKTILICRNGFFYNGLFFEDVITIVKEQDKKAIIPLFRMHIHTKINQHLNHENPNSFI